MHVTNGPNGLKMSGNVPIAKPLSGSSEGKPVNDATYGPTVFTVMQDKLGLKLEARKLPVEVFIVKHAEKVPTEN